MQAAGTVLLVAWPAVSLLLGRFSAGKHSNTSQFYITLSPAPQCDQKHVVVGRVAEGLEVLKQIGGCRAFRGCLLPAQCHASRHVLVCPWLQRTWQAAPTARHAPMLSSLTVASCKHSVRWPDLYG
jgi:cyclophilin family peptidyl-prolyl cis-trans isomerase